MILLPQFMRTILAGDSTILNSKGIIDGQNQLARDLPAHARHWDVSYNGLLDKLRVETNLDLLTLMKMLTGMMTKMNVDNGFDVRYRS